MYQVIRLVEPGRHEQVVDTAFSETAARRAWQKAKREKPSLPHKVVKVLDQPSAAR